jgi:hypothetical protein
MAEDFRPPGENEWLRDKDPWFVPILKALGIALGLAFLVGVVLLLLWIDSWWPDRLIPWVPVERL